MPVLTLATRQQLLALRDSNELRLAASDSSTRASARTRSAVFRNPLNRPADLGERERRLGLVAAKPHHHFDRFAEVGRGSEDVLALILATAKLRGDLPYGAAAHVEPRLAALLQRAANHEARGYRGLCGREASKKVGGERGYLEAAMSLAERLADFGEIEERTHGSRLDSPALSQRNSLFYLHSRRRSDIAAFFTDTRDAPPMSALLRCWSFC